MAKKLIALAALLGMLALMGAGCVPAAPQVTPTQPAAQPAAPTAAPTKAAAPTAAATKAPAPTAAPAAAGPTMRLKIIMVQHALCAWDSFWCTVENGIKQAAADAKVDVQILGPDKFDLEKVAQLIDQAVAAKPDAIGLTVTDAKLFKTPINRALQAGIPVVAYNAGNGPVVDDIPYLTYLGQDEYQGGYQAGQRLAAAGGKKGVCINQQVGHTGLDKRCKGFVDAFKEKNLTAEVLGITDDPARSRTTISDYYTSHPDVNAFLTLGPNGANPFYAFLGTANLKKGSFFHGTFDLGPEIIAKIKDGTTLFGIDQQPFLQGYGAVQILTMVKRFGIMPALPVTGTGPGFVDAKNVDFVADPKRPVNIIMVQHALCAWDSFWCVVEKGIQQAAADMGVKVSVLGPDKFDLEKVAQLIDQAVAAKPDAIGLTVTDAKLFKTPINRALQAGIPVVAYNAGNGPVVDDIPYLTYLGQDEYQGGYQAGQRLAAAGGKKGVCINQQVGHTGLDKRCKGFVDAFKEKNLTAEVLGITDDPARSRTTISDYYTSHPDVNAFLTLGPNGANPFYAFLGTANLKKGSFFHGTFDLGPEIIAKIKDGTTLFGIDQQPFLQGYGAVQALVLKARYGISPALPVTPTGPGFVDAKGVGLVEQLAGQYR